MRQAPSSKQTKDTKHVITNIRQHLMVHRKKLILGTLVFALIMGVVLTRSDGSSDVQAVGAPVDINYFWTIPAQNKDGETVNRDFSVNITNAQRQKRVLVQGQWLKAREGKVFLILNMDITNSVRAPLFAEPVDWARLIESEDKKIAPTVHQALVEIRPEATKTTNVGFVVDEGQKNFTIELGRLWDREDTIMIEF